jgi:hypothetical protein
VDSCANIFLNGGAKCQEGRNDSQDELKYNNYNVGA